jgi:hypothetical protein
MEIMKTAPFGHPYAVKPPPPWTSNFEFTSSHLDISFCKFLCDNLPAYMYLDGQTYYRLPLGLRTFSNVFWTAQISSIEGGGGVSGPI